ncbi:hypothetical protein [Faecalibacter rhinopitheci]|uniref:Uncharacterized protein n=1 Tax=Faecalibacter rhinopitheci TaxID=2779678 RepID=A0A8J7FMZ7_9FLAO|nr:hypothetical protein [Faecalibacter rhinopitheci]MBF0595884.1 hypothetical protein [Faecalibacter rhinopitheci]
MMRYYNINNIHSLQGVEIEGNSLWYFNHHQNLMVLENNNSITSKPTQIFQRAR